LFYLFVLFIRRVYALLRSLIGLSCIAHLNSSQLAQINSQQVKNFYLEKIKEHNALRAKIVYLLINIPQKNNPCKNILSLLLTT